MPDILTLSYSTATIANGAAISDVINCSDGRTLGALTYPASMTAATMTFTQSTTSGGAYTAIQDPDDETATYTITVPASAKHVILDARAFANARFVKLVGNTNESGAKSITYHRRVV